MDDVRTLAGLVHEFQRGPGEKREAVVIVVMTVNDPSVKEVLLRMRVDEETIETIHPTGIDVALDPLVIERHHQSGKRFRQFRDPVVAHAVIFGQDDLDWISLYLKLSRQSVNNVRQSTNFRGRRTLGTDH